MNKLLASRIIDAYHVLTPTGLADLDAQLE